MGITDTSDGITRCWQKEHRAFGWSSNRELLWRGWSLSIQTNFNFPWVYSDRHTWASFGKWHIGVQVHSCWTRRSCINFGSCGCLGQCIWTSSLAKEEIDHWTHIFCEDHKLAIMLHWFWNHTLVVLVLLFCVHGVVFAFLFMDAAVLWWGALDEVPPCSLETWAALWDWPFLLSHVDLLWPICMHFVHLIIVPTFEAFSDFGFSCASLFLSFFGLPGIFTYPGAFSGVFSETCHALIPSTGNRQWLYVFLNWSTE